MRFFEVPRERRRDRRSRLSLASIQLESTHARIWDGWTCIVGGEYYGEKVKIQGRKGKFNVLWVVYGTMKNRLGREPFKNGSPALKDFAVDVRCHTKCRGLGIRDTGLKKPG